MIHILLITTGLALTVSALAAETLLRPWRHTDALCGIGNALVSIANIPDDPFLATLCGAVAALCAHRWWNNGGGNGTRRRLPTSAPASPAPAAPHPRSHDKMHLAP
ncbi:hypothetical protein AF335_06165 [Streptomyces eurocidicus]|uniref:Uncharacterized protein n=1 Tax=Streptomyces eurocidicus TaxID=66423 RepID=A0A2N8NZN1_STREU|nr:hypothetical protein [Streptomyces eurocidicus]MBB5118711.1 hypothetical protein [Streptomyces eurocidicus]MBF6051474.1 hypothetical protein [Streptomyces eurocidicus]PNE34227.1 hypothetical protein AF335_06165 [Streptomyces eurocidicus]